MLNAFTSSAVASGVASGHVVEPLLNNQYRVQFKGKNTIATSQAGQLTSGQQITLAETAAGLKVIAAGSVSSSDIMEVLIDG